MKTMVKPANEEKPEDVSTAKNKQIERTARAHWQGNLKEGKGTISTQSGILEDVNYSFKTRFESGETATNPEELLAAAHAGCFTMAVTSILTKEGLRATSLDTKATVTMIDMHITAIHLAIAGTVDDLTAEEFSDIVTQAGKTCLISQVLNIPITTESYFIG